MSQFYARYCYCATDQSGSFPKTLWVVNTLVGGLDAGVGGVLSPCGRLKNLKLLDSHIDINHNNKHPPSN